MRGFIKFFAVIPLLAAMLCCQPDTVEQDIIARAEALMPSRPDSALLLLRQISPRQSTPQHADWCALRVWAEYRTYQPETDESALQTALMLRLWYIREYKGEHETTIQSVTTL
ncbi:MAG: hypothetical protein U0K35_06950 [Prevotella sp.]|nr:hypothetical protein [Prevotella sp.]